MSVRPPAVENRFYPGDTSSLTNQIDDFFTRAGGLPKEMDGKPPKAVIVPHAGYVYSGAIAARSFKEIAKGFKNIDTFVIIGPSHTGLGQKVSISKMDFETALGIVKNDTHLGDLILKHSNIIKLSEDAHILEHSIEIQLPFLQHLSELSGKDFSVVPMAMLSQNIHHSADVGNALHNAIKESGKRVVVISSSDMTHAGAAYGFNPCPKKELVDWIYEHDRRALEKIKDLDVEGFLAEKKEHRLTICGSGPIGAFIKYVKLEGADHSRVIQYTTSYNVSRSLRAIVGYASVVAD